MMNFRKSFTTKIISILIAVSFTVTTNVYSDTLSANTYLRKQLDFNNKEITPKYLCTMVAAAIHRSILEGRSKITPREILEDVIKKHNSPDLFQKIERSGIKIGVNAFFS